ncbi:MULTISPECIES: GtrA family protein [Bhargavaea]|uniref:GtrA family protein n=1 Tax=Bhargavaea changchunensis TaxID=2134037 RepID=A0ABW2NLH1_9BACL|nr:GtrA family protein [Bhargavaea sp. CC-171006]
MKRIRKETYRTFSWFTLSAVASFAIDIGLFWVFSRWLEDDSPVMYITFATVIARTMSAVFNYTVNRRLVFKSGSKNSFLKYAALALFNMAASAALVTAIHFLFRFMNETMLKVLVDFGLFIAGFLIQRAWVFAGKQSDRKHQPAHQYAIKKIPARK